MAVLGYLATLKRVLGLAFGAYFMHGFFHKCSFFNTISVDKDVISFFLLKISNKTSY